MALDTFLPEYFSQQFELPEMFEFPYIRFATDRSGMVPDGGNKVTWPDVEGSVVTQKYTAGSPLTDGEGQDAVLTLEVNEFDAVAIPLDDLDRVQKMPTLMAEYTLQANRELMWEINDHIRTQLQATARRAASGLTEPMRGNHAGLTSNVAAVSYHQRGSGNSTHPVWGTEGMRQDIVSRFDVDAGGFAKRHGWVSPDADTKGVAVVPIELANELRAYLRDDKPNLGAGTVVDSAFGLGRIMKVSGWEIVEDVTLPAVNVAAAANPAMRVNFLHPQNRSVYYARQLTTLETERIQGEFGTRLKALYMHGAVQGAARHIYGMDIRLVA